MSDDRASRIDALRSRVSKHLAEAEEAEEVSSSSEEIVIQVSKEDYSRLDRIKQRRDMAAETSFTRTVAMWCIIAGSILGLVTGSLLLSGNPSDLLSSSLFDSAEYSDVSGHALSQGGDGVEGVTITLMSLDKETEYFQKVTDGNGFYRFEEVRIDTMLMVVEKDGYVSIERIFSPSLGTEKPLTMEDGDGIREEGSLDEIIESNLEEVVAITTAIAILTLIFSLVGFLAAAEAQRGSKYRRTQYLCGAALFSRGLIFFGPLLILFGMALLAIAKEQFLDQLES